MYAAQPTLINRDDERRERDLWRRARRVGDAEATFQAGETIRCPGVLENWDPPSPCGLRVGVAKAGSKVIVRVRGPRLPAISVAGFNLPQCPACHMMCEQFVTWATPLEATGS